MALTKELIDHAVERYWREYDRYTKLAEFVGESCRKMLDANVIRGSVQWRAKNPDRLRAKLQKYLDSGDRAEEFTDLDSVFVVLKDLGGVRITTYVEGDRDRIVQLVLKEFAGFGQNGTVTTTKKDSPPDFYRATHCQVQLTEQDLVGRYVNLKGLGCELQICSLLAHVYNEIEHDLRYKPFSGRLSNQENELLNALGHLMQCGDTIINQTLDAVAARQTKNTEEFEDEYDFVVRMRQLFPNADNFAANAGQLFEACMKLELNSPSKIKDSVDWTEATANAGRSRAEELASAVNTDDTQLLLDPSSSDQLLVLLLADGGRVEKLKQLYPSGRGVGRAPRLLSVAKRLQELVSNMPEAIEE